MALRFPWEGDLVAEDKRAPAETTPGPPKRRGRRPATACVSRAPAPAWLYHHLTVTGPAEPLSAFAEAARGAGVIPWRLDFAVLEEDVFNLAAAQPPAARNLTIAGCRVLARQFRQAAEARHAQATALVGHSRACPFDLHTLLPMPAAVLRLGPTHPEALAWLSEHWGTTDRLRQVVARPKPGPGRRLPAGHRVIGYGFFTANETPRAAIAQLGARWLALRFELRPRIARA